MLARGQLWQCLVSRAFVFEVDAYLWHYGAVQRRLGTQVGVPSEQAERES